MRKERTGRWIVWEFMRQSSLKREKRTCSGKWSLWGCSRAEAEAARAAIVKYASDLGLFSPKLLWKGIVKHKRRKVTPEQLKKDLVCSEIRS